MEIQYISDIHIDLLTFRQINNFKSIFRPIAPICILAGDIGSPHKNEWQYFDFITFISSQFQKIFLIAGNHEHYTSTIEQTETKISDFIKDIPNITFLNNSFEDYNGFRFIGTTLWSEIKVEKYTTNDILCINGFSIQKNNELHNVAKEFLENELDNCSSNNINAIVISHHLPLHELTHPYYKKQIYENYLQCYSSDLSEMIERNKENISGWFYGHTHKGSMQIYSDIDFLCNPVGYLHENSLKNINQKYII
jgi:predicted phosphohydrolase